MGNWKHRLVMSGISTRCYTVDDMEMAEQFKTTAKYRKWKEERENKRKKLLKRRKVTKKEAFEKAYGDYTPEYNKLKVCSDVRARY